MLNKALVVVIALAVVLSVFCKVLYDKVGDLKESNKNLQKALESNLEATREKEKRNKDELERLHKQLITLSEINDDCLSSPVTDDLVVFLQQLQQDSNGSISFTFTKPSGVLNRN